MYQHIMIATDGSELAARGLQHGLKLAAPLGARVTVLTVTEPLREWDSRAAMAAGMRDPAGGYDRAMAEIMEERFAEARTLAAEHGVTVELKHEIDAHPAEAITRSAKLLGCDLIVMSSHGRRGASRFILGSQTAEVVTHTTIPVLVVR